MIPPKKDRKRILELRSQMEKQLGVQKGQALGFAAEEEFAALYSTLETYPEALRRHLKNNIFPAAAVFQVLLKNGYSREAAAKLTDELFGACMEKPAAMIRKLCRIPGFYKILPGIWKKAAFKLFGPEAGFAATMYETPGDRVRFDMTRCPYLESCQKLGCPEIAPTFCRSDDICYGNMHPRLKWNRTKTLARGGDCCDFDLCVEK